MYFVYGIRVEKKKNSPQSGSARFTLKLRGAIRNRVLVGVGTYEFAFSDVDNPEVFWIATKKDQAKIGWNRQVVMLKKLVEDRPALESVFGFHATEILSGELSWVKYLGKDSKVRTGGSRRVHCGRRIPRPR